MINLPSEDRLLSNLSHCNTWEEKYMYIIELGNYLIPLPDYMRIPQHLVFGCQSQVWIVMLIDNDGNIQFYGDSDALIVKGLIALIFVFYQGLTPKEILQRNIKEFFNKLSLLQHLTFSRAHGLEAIVYNIRNKAIKLISSL